MGSITAPPREIVSLGPFSLVVSVEGDHLLYAVLTTHADVEVAPVHPKAMPVVLRAADEIDRWPPAPTEEALELQRPLPDGALEIVAVGRRVDGPDSPLLE